MFFGVFAADVGVGDCHEQQAVVVQPIPLADAWLIFKNHIIAQANASANSVDCQ